MAQVDPSHEIPSDVDEISLPEPPSSSTSSSMGQWSAEPTASSSSNQPSCSNYTPTSSTMDSELSSTYQPESVDLDVEMIKATIRMKLNERSEVSYNILLIAADVDHHVRTVCEIGQILRKAGHYVSLAANLGHRVTALEHNIEFIQIDHTFYDLMDDGPTDWIVHNIEKFHAQPERLWKAWTVEQKYELGRLAFKFNAINRILERKLSNLERVYDVIIGNLETRYPCTYFAKIPFIPVTFMNPLPLHQEGPPPFSGYPTNGNAERAEAYRTNQIEVCRPLVRNLRRWWRSHGVEPLQEERWWIEEPRQLGIYRYPAKLEYTNIGPKISQRWFRIDPDWEKFANVNYFKLKNNVSTSSGKYIYISLGNIGQAEPEWMTKFLALLANIPHNFIYSQGTRLVATPENVWSAQNLNDNNVIPKVDLVITHGGCGALMQIIYHKKPIIVVPFFLDQYDNAQRVVECGLGQRLDTTRLSATTVSEAIEAVLKDKSIPSRLAEISKDMQISDSRLQLRYKIEAICREYREKREDRNTH